MEKKPKKLKPNYLVAVLIVLVIAFIYFIYQSQYSVSPGDKNTNLEAESPTISAGEGAEVIETPEQEPETPQEQPSVEVIPEGPPAEEITPAETPSETTIEITRQGFVPRELKISKGTTVKWINTDTIPHGLSAKDKSFYKGRLAPDEESSYTFTETGSFPYIDTIFISSHGTIVVE